MRSRCIVALQGRSGSGKTTLIEKALPELARKGLRVGVVKHAHHIFAPDTEGKDTDRFYKAGAAFVMGHDGTQVFARSPRQGNSFREVASHIPRDLDVVLVEGYKGSGLPAIWLQSDEHDFPPSEAASSLYAVLRRFDRGYEEEFIRHVREVVSDHHTARQVRAGLLIGGGSRRMGEPKTLLRKGGQTLAERGLDIFETLVHDTVLLGNADLPESLLRRTRLPDCPAAQGPLAGILSATRWAPDSAWIIGAVDMPRMEPEGWTWLLGQRRPGVWAVLPRSGPEGRVHATAACYEPEIFAHLEQLAAEGVFRLQRISEHPRIITPVIPEALAPLWTNVNTPEEWQAVNPKGA